MPASMLAPGTNEGSPIWSAAAMLLLLVARATRACAVAEEEGDEGERRAGWDRARRERPENDHGDVAAAVVDDPPPKPERYPPCDMPDPEPEVKGNAPSPPVLLPKPETALDEPQSVSPTTCAPCSYPRGALVRFRYNGDGDAPASTP